MYPEWVNSYESFESWILANLGERPDGMTLDRRDNDGHYEPGNLRWATHSQQRNNQRPCNRDTNTGERYISLNSRGVFSICRPLGPRIQGIKTLNEAIEIRDKYWASSLPIN